MKKSKKIVVGTLCIVLALVMIFAIGRLSFSMFKDKLESNIFPLKDPISVINTEYERAYGILIDWIYNPNDKNQIAGAADYVFVAEVTEVVGTGYNEVEILSGLRIDYSPYTLYKIRVLENIKGQLKTDEDITLKKNDGVEFFGKKVSFLEDDMLPDAGECYVFLGYADENGELTIGQFAGHNDIYICKADEYTGQEAVVEGYRDAVENMDESIRIGERYKSKYEIQ